MRLKYKVRKKIKEKTIHKRKKTKNNKKKQQIRRITKKELK